MNETGVNDSSILSGEQPSTTPPTVSPGKQLATYREERGWTIEQVASQLNLAPRQIAALENGDYAALPGMPIVRGFIRAYAKLLKVDHTPLVATLGGETVLVNDSISPRKTLSTPYSETRLPSMMERPGLPFKWIFGLLLIVLLGVAIWASQQGKDFAGMSKSAPPQAKESLPSADANRQTTVAKTGEANLASTPALPVPASSSATPSATTVSSPAPNVVVQPAMPSVATPSLERPVPKGKDTLLLKVREDSWVEIKRAGSTSASVSRVVKAGETEAIEVTEPVSLVIGNAAGVDVTLRGAPVDLKAGGGNVARLNLK
jgi:cytoskeleton protein RodZ